VERGQGCYHQRARRKNTISENAKLENIKKRSPYAFIPASVFILFISIIIL
jgi:hypothetical protein